MKKQERVKSNILFNEIIQKGKKVSNKLFTIFFIVSNNEKPLYGVAAPKKLGNAVIRNRYKRVVRALIDETKILFPKNHNYIIIVKEACINVNYTDRINALKQLVGEINEKQNN